ncbi:polyprenyl synthetase family protein [Propylenella binzhouense]|uniref:polyprenyl synthetase family protein n=1 Tax=Propylenella binzhouense TaxID=2555902 RepID=UPI0031B5F9DE
MAAALEPRLDLLLAEAALSGETMRPPRLLAAMRHALLDGGKRFRPFLLVESAALFGVPAQAALGAAAAVECLHTYSLIHDDLPAMDDDTLRRGRPTVHCAFDEATAILAGDALLTLAFDVLARDETHPDPAVRAGLVAALARAAGPGGMVGGQMLDLEAERIRLGEADIRRIQAMKTGALIASCCEMGGILGRATPAERSALRRYGGQLGLAYQMADDLLDLDATTEALGKAAAKDAARGKATLVALSGPAEARRLLEETVAACEDALQAFGARASGLVAAARFAAERTR